MTNTQFEKYQYGNVEYDFIITDNDDNIIILNGGENGFEFPIIIDRIDWNRFTQNAKNLTNRCANCCGVVCKAYV